MSLLFGLTLGFVFSWRLTLLALLVIPLMFISSLIHMRKIGENSRGTLSK
jgi:ABC-type bacteriocin/lantibiotic exporter with double-glycine peptidase domain